MTGVVVRRVPRPDAAAVAALERLGVATAHEAQGRAGLMHPYMRPVWRGARVAGRAVTALCHPGDNWMIHVAAEVVEPGDVLVVACSSESTDGGFGALLATSLRARGARGVVLDLGCRDAAELAEVAAAVAGEPGVELAGIAAYEGNLATAEQVRDYFGAVRQAARALAGAGLLPGEVIVTAGGSAWFDLFAAELGGDWLPGRRLRTILRSGAYISHDDGVYRAKTPFTRIPGGLAAALEVWAQVTSVPEPGLAIAGMGKREAPYDEGLPVPLRVRRAGGSAAPADGLEVTRLNDHHAFVSVRPGAALAPGDLICFGISHPCTAFDKWQVIPVVDDDYTVIDLIRTYF